jgi:hypothetical protein
MRPEIEKKVILWYQISNSSYQKKFGKNQKICDWILRLETVCKIEVEEIEIIALPWFAVPSLMTNLFS